MRATEASRAVVKFIERYSRYFTKYFKVDGASNREVAIGFLFTQNEANTVWVNNRIVPVTLPRAFQFIVGDQVVVSWVVSVNPMPAGGLLTDRTQSEVVADLADPELFDKIVAAFHVVGARAFKGTQVIQADILGRMNKLSGLGQLQACQVGFDGEPRLAQSLIDITLVGVLAGYFI